MKTLLMTTAAALALTISAPHADAGHNGFNSYGQNSFSYGNRCSSGFNSPGYGQFNSGYGSLNSGWNSGYGNNYGWNSGLGGQFGYSQYQQPSIVSGGCYRGGGQMNFLSNGRYRTQYPYGQFGYSPLR